VRRIKELERLNGDMEMDNKAKEQKITDLTLNVNKLMEDNIKANGKIKELEGHINNMKIEQ